MACAVNLQRLRDALEEVKRVEEGLLNLAK